MAANILDYQSLDILAQKHQIIITLEDNILDGGFGQKVAAYLGPKNISVLNYGQKRVYTDQTPINETYLQNHLTVEQIPQDLKTV